MEITKERAIKWLKDNHHSRDWLAEKCGVKRGTVNNWLTTPRGLPAKASLIIINLIKIDDAKSKELNAKPQNLVLTFERERFTRICKTAAMKGQSPQEWAEAELKKLAQEQIKGH
ncbi:MAG: hypothetical protein ACSHX0_14015 [Akkermansiaceae bacterium]